MSMKACKRSLLDLHSVPEISGILDLYVKRRTNETGWWITLQDDLKMITPEA